MKLKAIAVYKWEDDANDWPEKPKTPAEHLKLVQEYVKDDWASGINMKADSIEIMEDK